MINLLPPELKKELQLAQKKKVSIILGITVLLPLICLCLILSSLLLYVSGEKNVQAIVLDEAKKQYQTPDFLKFKDIIQKNNKNIKTLSSFYKKTTLISDALAAISSQDRPAGLYLTSISLSKNETGIIQADVAGFSESREDLLLFQKNIQANPAIQNPLFSPESWVEAKNVKFYVTFQIRGQQ